MIQRFEREKPRMWDGRRLAQMSIVQRKLDGWRVMITATDKDWEVRFRKEVIPLHLVAGRKWFDRVVPFFSAWTVVEGELYHPSRPASDVKSLVLAQSDELLFEPFAVPFFAGRDLRRQHAHAHYEDLLQHMITDPKNPPWWDWFNQDATVEEYEKMAREAGWEGVIIKERAYELWWKVKVCHTIDAVVTAIKPGYGKYRGQCGALVVALWDAFNEAWQPIASCSGMSDEVRAGITDADIGRVVEIKHNGWMSKGRLRHPNFVRWRDDKPMEECIHDFGN